MVHRLSGPRVAVRTAERMRCVGQLCSRGDDGGTTDGKTGYAAELNTARARERPDTIAAIATPPGTGGVGIVRVSGPLATVIGRRLAGVLGPPRQMVLRPIYGSAGQLLDRGLVVWFNGPRSFTGEDVVEFHVHGGRKLLEAVLHACLVAGARLAEPGEFTRRAFVAGRMTLVEAEAVADLIEAESEAALRLAAQQLAGRFVVAVERWRTMLLEAVAGLFAAIDYPDEIDALPEARSALAVYERICRELDEAIEAGRAGRAIREGIQVVLAGPPNAGKSSLFNALVGYPRAIVTEVPGTTRDTIEETLDVDGLRLCLIDTAGWRQTEDPVEAIGVARGEAAIREADVVLWIEEATGQGPAEDASARLAGRPVIRVAQKGDLIEPGNEPDWADVVVSARTGEGLERLKAAIVERFPRPDDVPTANVRHLDALIRAAEALRVGGDAPVDVLAQAGEAALWALGEITGESVHESVLDQVFSRFCLGK